MRKLLAAFLLMLSCAVHAQAQSICPQTAIQGYVLTPGQWSACWSAKQDALGYSPVNRNGDTMNGRLVTYPPGTATAGFSLTPGTTPASPANGDMWATSADLYAQIGGTTRWLTAIAGNIEFVSTAVNFNANADTIITLALPPGKTRYAVDSVRISNASHTLTTATVGVFTAASGAGVALASDQAITVSATADATNNNAMKLTLNAADTETYTLAGQPRAYVRVGTPEGATATADVTITIKPLP